MVEKHWNIHRIVRIIEFFMRLIFVYFFNEFLFPLFLLSPLLSLSLSLAPSVLSPLLLQSVSRFLCLCISFHLLSILGRSISDPSRHWNHLHTSDTVDCHQMLSVRIDFIPPPHGHCVTHLLLFPSTYWSESRQKKIWDWLKQKATRCFLFCFIVRPRNELL